MSHYYSHVLQVTGFSLICFPSCDQKRPAFPATCPCIDRQQSVFILYSVQTGSLVRTVATLNAADFPLLSVYWIPAGDSNATKKTICMILQPGSITPVVEM